MLGLLLSVTVAFGFVLLGGPSSLAPSGCVTISADNQAVANVKITCAGNAISCSNHSGVTIQNVVILFSSGDGINANACDNMTLLGVNINFTAAPASGPITGDNYCIRFRNAASISVTNFLGQNCVEGINLDTITGTVTINYFKVVNVRTGTNEYGTGIQCNSSPARLTISNFYLYNSLSIAATGDNINIAGCDNTGNTISNGLIDGNTQNLGSGITLEPVGSVRAFAAISNVDIVNWCNVALQTLNTTNVPIVNVRARNSYVRAGSTCADGQVRAANGTPYATYDGFVSPATSGTTWTGVQYFNIASGSAVTPIYDCPSGAGSGKCGTPVDITSVDFTIMTPVNPAVPY